MGRWSIWSVQTHSRCTRERVGSLWPNYSTIVRSSVITSIKDITLTTTTIGAILLFQLRGLGRQSIGPTSVMPNSWHWQRSMQITYGSPWSTELMRSLSWIFGAIWDGRWSRTLLMKRQRLGELMEDGREQRGGPWETMSLWQLHNIVENGLLMRINGRGSSSPTRSRYATTKVAMTKNLKGGVVDAIRDSSDVLSVMQLMFLMLIPNN